MFWKGHPLGLPILGTKETGRGLPPRRSASFLSEPLPGEAISFSPRPGISGTVNSWSWSGGPSDRSPVHPFADRIEVPVARPGKAVLRKELEQVHLIIGAPAPSAVSPERHAAFLLNAVLGGSMSSRLFQEIREKRGLAYEICSYLTPYHGCRAVRHLRGNGQRPGPGGAGSRPGGAGEVLRPNS